MCSRSTRGILRSTRSAGLVITNPHVILPLREGSKLAPLIGLAASFYGYALVTRDFVDILNEVPGSFVLKILRQFAQLCERLFKQFGHRGSVSYSQLRDILTKRDLYVAKQIL